jgi:hypothetical protein
LAGASAQPTAPSAPAPAGVVTANAPHVAAVAAATPAPETPSPVVPPADSECRDMSPGHHEAINPAGETSAAQSSGALRDRGDNPLYDPYLASIQAELTAAEQPAPKSQSPAPETETEKNPERVSDARDLPA